MDPEHRFVGEGTMSLEGTSEVNYLWRPHPCVPHPPPRPGFVGEIGWSLPELNDLSAPITGHQIQVCLTFARGP